MITLTELEADRVAAIASPAARGRLAAKRAKLLLAQTGLELGPAELKAILLSLVEVVEILTREHLERADRADGHPRFR